MHIANQPAPFDIPHDVLNRSEGIRRRWLVVHREKNARDQLNHQHDQRQNAEHVPVVEVFRRVVLGHVLFEHRVERKSRIDPSPQPAGLACGLAIVTHERGSFDFAALQAVCEVSLPTITRVSVTNVYGGTVKFAGAGTPLKTRPDRSNFDPWQGQ